MRGGTLPSPSWEANTVGCRESRNERRYVRKRYVPLLMDVQQTDLLAERETGSDHYPSITLPRTEAS